jgi:hypothetical protein
MMDLSSELNHLIDISLDLAYIKIYGFTLKALFYFLAIVMNIHWNL